MCKVKVVSGIASHGAIGFFYIFLLSYLLLVPHKLLRVHLQEHFLSLFCV